MGAVIRAAIGATIGAEIEIAVGMTMGIVTMARYNRIHRHFHKYCCLLPFIVVCCCLEKSKVWAKSSLCQDIADFTAISI